MTERNHIDKLNALSSSVIGFEFEFYTNMLKGEAAESIGKEVKKKVQVSEKYHSDLKVTSSLFKLEPDYSGGNKMVELITGPMEYSEAIPVMIKILNWIEKNGWTDDRCAFQFSVSFDKFRREIKDRIENLDKLKFILGLDENFIYSKFGNRSNNVYANTVKRVVPVNRFSILENINYIDPKMFKVPDEKRSASLLNQTTYALLAITTAMAWKLTDLSFVSSISGAVFGTALIFVFPSLMFRAAVKNLGDKATASQKKEGKFAMIVNLLGIVIAAIGTKMSVGH